jgi:hypothetical protein
VFSGLFIAEEVDGVRDRASGDTTVVDVQTLLEVFFEHVPEIYSLMKPVKSRTTLLKKRIIRISELSDVRLKEFCLFKRSDLCYQIL